MLLFHLLLVLVIVGVAVEGCGKTFWLSLLEHLEKSTKNEVLSRDSPPDTVRCDDTFVCPDGFTCCKFAIGYFCCPSGMTCGATPMTCNGNVFATPLLTKVSPQRRSLFKDLDKSTKNEVLSQDSPPDTVRCDGTFVCPDGFTCCKSAVGYFCCPSWMTCGATPMTCNGNVFATPLLTKVSPQRRSLFKDLDKSTKNEVLSQDSPPDTVRCNDTFVCPDGFTCCKSAVGYFCCPSGMTCGATPMTCNGNVFATPLLTKVSPQRRSLFKDLDKSTKNEVLSQDSPPDTVRCDDTFVCPDGFTCCKSAVGYFCCPSGMTCGATPMTCNGNVFATPLLTKVSPQRRSLFKDLDKSTKNEVLSQDSPPDTVRCDDTFVCPDGFICCKSAVGYFCCPSGMTCGATPMTCNGNVFATPLLTKVSPQRHSLFKDLDKSSKNEVLSQDSPPVTVRCDASFVCPDSFTCCKFAAAYFCCPPGMTCGPTPMTCKGNVFATPLLTKIPNFDKERTDYRGPVGEQSVPQGILQPGLKVGDQRHERQMTDAPQQRAGPTSLGKKGEANLQYVTQDDAGLCPPGLTACRSPSGVRCCPLPHASCCINGLHCCRAGFRCVNNTCRPSTLFSSLPDSETKLSGFPSSTVFFFNQQVLTRTRPRTRTRNIARARYVAAGQSGPGFGSGKQSGASSPGDGLVSCNATVSCDQNQTCCWLSTGGWGCCSYQNAVCCQDGLHCCPNGYTCDQSKSSCSKNGKNPDWSLKHRALKKEP
ncbi:progranulin-like [Haliotis cracherodii]|uniref:progranulin-like n=1 Tax=Haliotis cracherodii TaxID=6455 RepID=UPI0039EA4771